MAPDSVNTKASLKFMVPIPESSPTQEIANMIVANLTNRSKNSKDFNFQQDDDDAGGSFKSLDDS